MKLFRKIKTSTNDVMQLQNQVEQVLNPITKKEILDGVLLKDIIVTTAGIDVEHALLRQPLGWILVDNQADATVYRTFWSDRILTLSSSATTTISIWVF